MTATIVKIPGLRDVPASTARTVKSSMDTVIVSPDAIAKWKIPPFQRPLKMNAKIRELVDSLKAEGGIIPGVITIGVLSGERYLVDGQHRIEAFKLTELEEGIVNVRLCHFDSLADMAQEFVNLNSAFVRLKTDDILRGLESSNDALRRLRRKCPFVGYGYFWANPSAPIISANTVINLWFSTDGDTPMRRGGVNTSDLADWLAEDGRADKLADCLECCFTAWGRDKENRRMWSTLNLGLCMWIWKQTVTGKWSGKSAQITPAIFTKCLMSLSADHEYIDWLHGRAKLSDRDRAPAYRRIRKSFVTRMREEGIARTYFPAPAWAPQ